MKPYTPHEFKVLFVRECEPMTELADTPEIVAQYWRTNIPKADWYDPAKEAVVVLVLNTRRRIIGHNLVALGSLDTCPIAPREVFRPALAAAGSAIVLLHNHPSENPEPSIADIRVTRDLVRAGQLLKVEVLDHVIIGGQNQHRSLRELGYLV
jgi:DNA repair protein RadC